VQRYQSLRPHSSTRANNWLSPAAMAIVWVAIADGESPGNIGPPLAHLSARFNDKEALWRQIWDAGRFNPATSMPPFGKNAILNAAEIDAIADYLWCLP
jgi:sulfur-oxidizing protein SoxX